MNGGDIKEISEEIMFINGKYLIMYMLGSLEMYCDACVLPSEPPYIVKHLQIRRADFVLRKIYRGIHTSSYPSENIIIC